MFMNNKKKLIAAAFVLCIAAVCSLSLFNKNQTDNVDENYIKPIKHNEAVKDQSQKKDENASVVKGKESAEVKAENSEEHKSDNLVDNSTKKPNLYDLDASSSVPLSTIGIMSSLPENIQHKISDIAQSNNIFMTVKSRDNIIVITDNPNNIRHSVEFNEISLKNGHQVKTTLGYNDKINDSDNDIWEYDETTKQPIRHSKYNKDGDIEFVENWYYDDSPIKYVMKDAEGHVISMRKETIDGGTNLRVEHLLYDKAGNTKINVSATYEGADVKRFTYYNADKPSEGGSVFTEYNDGLKTKEILYSNDLKVINSYTSEYKNGEREQLTIWDNNNREVQKLLPDESHEVL